MASTELRSTREVLSVAERIIRRRIVASSPAPGGYTPAARFVVDCDDGSRAFVKGGTTARTRAWVASEWRFYRDVEAGFLPRAVGFADDVLVLEDLRDAHWPPPWRPRDVDRLLDTLDQVAVAHVPFDLPTRAEAWAIPHSWRFVASDPAPFLSLGMCSRRWYARAIATLIDAETSAPIHGSHLLHADVRSDNVCFVGDRPLIVDWNNACRGAKGVDVAFLLPSLEYEGGPCPEAVLPDAPGLAAVVSGFFARLAGFDEVPHAPRVRWVQKRQLQTALPWAARALGLPPPDGRLDIV